MSIMVNLKAAGKTILLASHDPLITEHPAIERIISIKDGRLHVP
jgi:putative ABC transport system ATP-binding protein